MSAIPFSLILLVGLAVIAIAIATYALVTERQRRTVLERASQFGDRGSLVLTQQPQPGAADRLVDWIVARLPGGAVDEKMASALVHAGWDGAAAPAIFVLARIACAVLIPLLVLAIAPRDDTLIFVAMLVLSIGVGLLLPPAFVNNRAEARRGRLRKSIPDCLDLLVVCVEAGTSLDAAMLRVARELGSVHPELAGELLYVNRRVNAGIPREQALHGLWGRTGVEDLRTLAASMVQSEKWGTSIATVLRVYAEALRRKRKQAAEKKAATAPLKMMIPLALFIFPTLFIVLLGPAIIQITEMFRNINR
jgi:tight adherence protein C